MFHRAILFLFLSLLAVASLSAQNQMPGYLPDRAMVPKAPSADERPVILGRSALVIDARSGKILYEKNSLFQQPAASTQKLLTALVVTEAGNLQKPVTIQPSDTQCEPSKVYLRAGEVYTRQKLLEALLVHSGNDCARALARDNAGSHAAFARKMNERARELGAYNSHFINPNGLPAEGQYSCARDIAIVARAAYRNVIIRRIVATKTLDFSRPGRGIVTYTNTNKLLRLAPFCNGMKTGYTDAAGHCLVSSGTGPNRDAIVVVLHSNKVGIVSDSLKLLTWSLGI